MSVFSALIFPGVAGGFVEALKKGSGTRPQGEKSGVDTAATGADVDSNTSAVDVSHGPSSQNSLSTRNSIASDARPSSIDLRNPFGRPNAAGREAAAWVVRGVDRVEDVFGSRSQSSLPAYTPRATRQPRGIVVKVRDVTDQVEREERKQRWTRKSRHIFKKTVTFVRGFKLRHVINGE